MPEELIVLDLETTGLDPRKDKILEIGALLVCGEKVEAVFETLIDPGVQIPYPIQRLTGITQAMAEGGVNGEEALSGFLEFCGGRPVLGHNIRFDYSFIKQQAVVQGRRFAVPCVDTLLIARKALAELPSRSLQALCRHYHIVQEGAHRAVEDCRSTWKLYQYLKRDYAAQYPELFVPKPIACKAKKQSAATVSQKVYLKDLLKYHRIETDIEIERLSKSEASRMIDRIILQYGRIKR